MNAEGFGWMDYNNDGWLDLIIENHSYGIDIYENPANGTASFTHVTPNGSSKGLPTAGTTGDYMALADYDDDGDVDILARKEGDWDLWTNSGSGTFSSNTSMNENASNGNKGGVLFCDFDNDGDFDFYWSDNGTNQIFEQTGVNSGVFSATAEPATSSGVTISNSIDGCSCGDVDNDGDMDLFLGGSSGANSYLFTNDGGGTFNFTQNNMGISGGGNTEGNSFADYDNDLDLYINITGGNKLYRNSLNNTNYLKVKVLRDLGGGITRDDLGATVVLKDCSGNVVSGIRQVSSVKGHGSNDPAIVHFGLPSGPMSAYLVEVRFTTLSGVRTIIDTTIVPFNHTDQTITIISPTGAGIFHGCTSALPIELMYFSALAQLDEVYLNWETASEFDNDFYTIERSIDGYNWETIEQVDGAGNSTINLSYNSIDKHPYYGISYYRLKQTDFDGNYEYSPIESINIDGQGKLRIYPDYSESSIVIFGEKQELENYKIINSLGQDVTYLIISQNQTNNGLILNVNNLSTGMYFIKSKSLNSKFIWQ